MRLALIGVGLAIWACRRTWRRREMRMSDRWLAAQDREDNTRGVDGVCWRWPANQPGDAVGWWNRTKLKNRG